MGWNVANQPVMNVVFLASRWNVVRMVSLNDHSDLTNIWEIFLLMLFQINSIGFRSGE